MNIKSFKKNKKLIAAILVILGVILVLFTPASSFLVRVCGVLVIVAGVFLLFIKNKAAAKEAYNLRDDVERILGSGNEGSEAYIDSLCRLNLALRLESSLSEGILGSSEKLIEQLLAIIPKAKKDMGSSETTFELIKLAETHFPELLKEYLDLNESGRGEVSDELLAQFNELEKYMAEISINLERGQRDQFDLASSFIKAKFEK